MSPPVTTRTLEIPNCRDEASKVQREIMALVEDCAFGDDEQFAIRLALEEALSNAIRHGNCNDPEKSVTVEYAISESRVEVTICDEGCGFTPGHLPDPTLEENLQRPCGRGVMLIQAYMTEVRYNEAGNCVTMVKRPEESSGGSDADPVGDGGDAG